LMNGTPNGVFPSSRETLSASAVDALPPMTYTNAS
jgi:hypothetical protein